MGQERPARRRRGCASANHRPEYGMLTHFIGRPRGGRSSPTLRGVTPSPGWAMTIAGWSDWMSYCVVDAPTTVTLATVRAAGADSTQFGLASGRADDRGDGPMPALPRKASRRRVAAQACRRNDPRWGRRRRLPTAETLDRGFVARWCSGKPQCMAATKKASKPAIEEASKDRQRRRGRTARSIRRRNRLDDSDFAFTKKRKEPITDTRHVRNVSRRSGRSVTDVERDRLERIVAAAKKFGVEVSEHGWLKLFKGAKASKKATKADGEEGRRRRRRRAESSNERTRRGPIDLEGLGELRVGEHPGAPLRSVNTRHRFHNSPPTVLRFTTSGCRRSRGARSTTTRSRRATSSRRASSSGSSLRSSTQCNLRR